MQNTISHKRDYSADYFINRPYHDYYVYPPPLSVIRKQVIFLFIFGFIFFVPLTGLSQEYECEPYELDEEARRTFIEDVPLIKQYLAAPTGIDSTIVPVFFHIVRKDDGTYGSVVNQPTESFLNQVLDSLTAYFEPIGLKFGLCGLTYINNTQLYQNSQGTLSGYSYVSNALNVYHYGAPGASFAQSPVSHLLPFNNSIVLKAGSGTIFLNPTFKHEVGHSYGLLHTFHPELIYNNPENPLQNPPQGLISDHPYNGPDLLRRELVIRDTSLGKPFPYPNCETGGDLVCDTYASCNHSGFYYWFPDPNDPDCYDVLTFSGCDHGCLFNMASCTYEGNYEDYNGDTLTGDITDNLMSYFGNTCAKNLTQGQFDRMCYYNEYARKPQYDSELCLNLIDSVEFEDTNVPVPEVGLRYTHPGDTLNLCRVISMEDGKFQGSIFNDTVTVIRYKLGSGTYPNFNFTATDWHSGVNIMDAIAIQRHILAADTLNGYRQIAADVNHSGTISGLDVIDVRKLLLSVSDTFPNTTSPWRFVPEYIPQDHSAAFHDDPFGMTLNGVAYTAEAPYLDNEWQFVQTNGLNGKSGFDAVKLGDVNGTTSDEFVCDPQYVDLVLPTNGISSGRTMEIDFKVYNFEDIQGFQLGVNLDYEALEYKDIFTSSSGLTGFTKVDNFGLTKVDDNELRSAWFGENLSPVTKSDGSILFTLKLKTRTYVSNLNNVLFLDDVILKNEFISEDCPKEVQIEGVVRFVASKENNSPENTEISGYGIEDLYCFPNPFQDEVDVIFRNSVPDFEGILLVTDALGRLVYKTPVAFEKGINRKKLTSKEIPGSGLFFISVQSNGKTITQRLFKD